MFELYKDWMEFFFFVLVIIGILISLTVPSAVISYLVIFLTGLMAGRLIYERKNKIKLPYFMIILGFIIGYLIGIYYGSKLIIIILFAIGSILSYNIYDKKIIKDTKF